MLAERENEWSHQASNYQIKMMKYQVRMLGTQELIASRTKRDNTVMKVIAVLTSLFLPGAFIAVSLTLQCMGLADFERIDSFQCTGVQLEREGSQGPTLHDILVFHSAHYGNPSHWIFSVVCQDVV